MRIAERIAKKFKKFGEAFTVNGNTYYGVFRILDSGTMRTYLDDVEVMGVVKPGLLLVTKGDATISANNTITRDGRTFTVLKTSQHRIGAVSVVKLVILT